MCMTSFPGDEEVGGGPTPAAWRLPGERPLQPTKRLVLATVGTLWKTCLQSFYVLSKRISCLRVSLNAVCIKLSSRSSIRINLIKQQQQTRITNYDKFKQHFFPCCQLPKMSKQNKIFDSSFCWFPGPQFENHWCEAFHHLTARRSRVRFPAGVEAFCVRFACSLQVNSPVSGLDQRPELELLPSLHRGFYCGVFRWWRLDRE